MLLITGTGRSGTSVLAKYCLVMGNDPGGRWRRRADAGYEDENAVAFSRAFHRHGRPAALASAAGRPFDRAVVKVPHVVKFFEPALLDCWLEVKPELRVLLARRPFEAVGRSYASRPKVFKMGTDAAAIAEKMKSQYEAFVAYLGKKGVPYRVVPMLSDDMTFGAIHEGLTTFGGLRLAFDPAAARKLGLRVTDATPQGVWRVVYDKDGRTADRLGRVVGAMGRRLAAVLAPCLRVPQVGYQAAVGVARGCGPALANLLVGVRAQAPRGPELLFDSWHGVSVRRRG